jgi:hypothetical protein
LEVEEEIKTLEELRTKTKEIVEHFLTNLSIGNPDNYLEPLSKIELVKFILEDLKINKCI